MAHDDQQSGKDLKNTKLFDDIEGDGEFWYFEPDDAEEDTSQFRFMLHKNPKDFADNLEGEYQLSEYDEGEKLAYVASSKKSTVATCVANVKHAHIRLGMTMRIMNWLVDEGKGRTYRKYFEDLEAQCKAAENAGKGAQFVTVEGLIFLEHCADPHVKAAGEVSWVGGKYVIDGNSGHFKPSKEVVDEFRKICKTIFEKFGNEIKSHLVDD